MLNAVNLRTTLMEEGVAVDEADVLRSKAKKWEEGAVGVEGEALGAEMST